jgi:DNA ligase-1
MRFIGQDGQERELETMTNVVINYKGFPVSVGSGFSASERDFYHKNPAKIMGKTISVQYFEVSQDRNGKPSLRFPTFKGIYGAKRTI